MSEPVLELIAQAVETQAQTITVANGYLTDVGDAIRRHRRGDREQLGEQILVSQGERRKPETEVDGKTCWVQPFHLDLVLRPGEDEETIVDTLVNRFVADVEKCFPEVSSPSWWAAGITAHRVIGPVALADSLAGCEGARMTIEIDYRTAYGNPYTAG